MESGHSEVQNDTVAIISADVMAERRTTAIIFGIFASVGVILNIIPLVLTHTTKLRYNFVHIFVTNLSAADLLLSSSFLFGNTFYVMYRETMPLLACRWLGFLTFTAAYQEFFFPPLLSINRYIALYHQAWYDRIYTKWSMCVIVVFSWLLCGAMPLVFFMYHKTGFDTDNEHCCVTVVGDHTWTVIYWLIVILPLVVFCDGTMLFCNTKMYQKLHSHAQKSDMAQHNVAKQNKELMWFLWADMSLPICFHTVYHVLKFVVYDRQSAVVRRFFAMLYLMNSCMRGFLTLALLRPYRVAMRQCLCFLKKQSTIVPIGNTITQAAPGKSVAT